MSKKSIILLAGLMFGLGVLLAVLVMHVGTKPAPAMAALSAPEAWLGTWQMGPTIPTTVTGCDATNGFGRFTGYFYAAEERIYFLGGRCETDTITTGRVFYFDVNTKEFTFTGTTMPNPVSNYQIAAIPDDGRGHGIGLYIVGGRLQSGTQTNVVQVYYPDDNLAETITTDPFPPTPARTPGGVMFANGKLYVFGGFDGTNMYATTHAYDPAGAAGSRWSDTGCALPTGRSYIAGVTIGNVIYALGGDELPALTPINDTVVLDTDNMAACWQDDVMADLPVADGDAAAVYVDEGYLGGDAGGIFLAGGPWPAPGPDRWVFRYDVASDTWETFPSLVIPDPATGRRNYALVYAHSATKGIGTGFPGIWAFGGYDGSGTNAMTDTTEFFSIETGPVLILPETMEVSGVGGTTLPANFWLLNHSGITDTFVLTYTANVTWSASLPASIGPVPDGGETAFALDVDLPANLPCPSTSVFTVTATSIVNPLVTDNQSVNVRLICGVGGVVRDGHTGLPIENAYVWMQTDPDGLTGEYFDGFTDADGLFSIADVTPGSYYFAVSAEFYQPSFYPSGWPGGAERIIVSGNSVYVETDLDGSVMSVAPVDGFSATLAGSESITYTLYITNDGAGPLNYWISAVDSAQPEPPAPADMPVPGLPRVDPQLAEEFQASTTGTADFVVVLASQADLSSAYAISDWKARGQLVYDRLTQHAEQTQIGLRQQLTAFGVSYQPLYIVNALIVRGGNQTLVNVLAERSDVAQIVANHRIAVEANQTPLPTWNFSTAFAPTTVEWNILRVNADAVWDMGITGEGIVVSEIDTGTQWNHPALRNHYRGWDGSSADHNYNWFDPYNQSPSSPTDVNGHGTHVMGTMVGEDATQTNQVGMAPGAQWISCKGGDNVSGYLLTTELLQCAQWILAPTDLSGNNPMPELRPNVVNNSWGGGQGDYWFSDAISAWRAAGIFAANSNGNNGPSCMTSGSPGDYWNNFSSGSSNSANAISSFSSRGPALNTGILKPDITAPGENIRSSLPGSTYGNYSGTSMASPHTAGAVALLWSAAPELIGQVELTGWVLQQSAVPVLSPGQLCGDDTPTSHPNNVWGWGLLDIEAAVNLALSGGVTPDWVWANPWGGEVLPGETAEVAVVFSADMLPVGQYTATLWVVANDPYIQEMRLPLEITVLNVPPSADFTSNSPAPLGEMAIFTSTVSGDGTFEYLWEFGDGITSTLPSPTHTYTAIDSYWVSLTVNTEYGSDSVGHPFEVEGLPPSADFISNMPVEMGETAIFTVTNLTGTGPFEFMWDFGDGESITSTLTTVTHVYAITGTFTVTLTVTNDWGSATTPGEIEVVPPSAPTYEIYLPILFKLFLP